MKMHNNKDVPIETILRHSLREKGQLEAEVAYLQNEIRERDKTIENLNKAIADFKVWQSRMADYKYRYWLNEGLKMMEQLPPKEEVDALKNFLGNSDKFDKYYKKLSSIKNNIEVYAGRLKSLRQDV